MSKTNYKLVSALAGFFFLWCSTSRTTFTCHRDTGLTDNCQYVSSTIFSHESKTFPLNILQKAYVKHGSKNSQDIVISTQTGDFSFRITSISANYDSIVENINKFLEDENQKDLEMKYEGGIIFLVSGLLLLSFTLWSLLRQMSK